jgi:hypothetical protein
VNDPDPDADGAAALVARLRETHGGSVRAVATYDRDGYTLRYATAAVREGYSEPEMDAIYDDVVLQDVGQPLQERLFDDIGAVRGAIRLFEDGTVAHFWPTDGTEGLFVAFDAEADPGVRSLLDLAATYYS